MSKASRFWVCCFYRFMTVYDAFMVFIAFNVPLIYVINHLIYLKKRQINENYKNCGIGVGA